LLEQNFDSFFFLLSFDSFYRMGEANDNSSIGEENVAPPKIKLESFESLSNYGRALLYTPCRLLDRVTARSNDETELVEIKKRSQHEMKKTLSWWDLIWFGMGSVIGSGIFVLTGLEVRNTVGPAVVLSYVVSGISAMLSVFCYTEFAVEIPVAGTYSFCCAFFYLFQIV
jgi:APA family basic amino acid/polyamine antiporter